jgi:hypothetical protein
LRELNRHTFLAHDQMFRKKRQMVLRSLALLILCYLSTAEAADTTAKLAANPHHWPREVALTREAEFPAVYSGREVGKIKVLAGTKVELVAIQEHEVEVRFREGIAKLPLDTTNLAQLADAPPSEPATMMASPSQKSEVTSFEQAMSEAMKGNRSAIVRLAEFYERGEGVKQDNKKAYIWHRVAQELTKKSREETERKLDEIILPEVNFVDTPVFEAIENLRQQSIALDTKSTSPERSGVNITTKLDKETGAQVITLDLKDARLRDVFDYISKLAVLRMKVESYGLVFTKLEAKSRSLQTREYRLPKDLLEQLADARGGSRAQEFLESQGVSFPPGASAVFLPSSNRLVVRTTEDGLDLIEAMIESAGGSPAHDAPIKPELTVKMSSTELRWAEEEVKQITARISRSIWP